MPNANIWKTQIEHIVVLMMENRSFDHLLGDYSRINNQCDGVDHNNPATNNVSALSYNFVQQPETQDNFGLQLKPPFDPRHEFVNVQAQLGGDLTNPMMTGFAQDAYSSFADKDGYKTRIKTLVQRVMNYIPFGNPPVEDPLPAIQGLARAFTVCDKWFSSLPGPTWPNRFFAMMGSAHGRVLMPSDWQDAPSGIANFCDHVCKDSIFSLMSEKGVSARVYSDGTIPLALMTKGCGERHEIQELKQDIDNNNLPAFAWIEPDYSYEGSDGNSQHPPEDLRYGDAFIARIYNTLRSNNAVWNKTLFVLLYDEHGGFYDHVVPPKTVAPDNIAADVNFKFDRLGVRVPAILSSPWLGKGIDHSQYDHTSLLAFVCERFGLDRAKLGRRVATTQHFGKAQIWLDQARTDTPITLRVVKVPPRTRALIEHETGLAAENRKLIQGLHAYLNGNDVQAAWDAAAGPTRSIGSVNHPDRLEDMVGEITAALARTGELGPLQHVQHLARTTVVPVTGPLRLLCLHGVGHGDASTGWQADPGWQDKWHTAIIESLEANGIDPKRVKIKWLRYDDLFGDGPSTLQMLRAMPLLLESIGTTLVQERAFGLDIPYMLKWTAGMAVQWMEDDVLRTKLCDLLINEIGSFDPHVILGHSLGSLIAYDAMRRSVAAGGTQLDKIDGRIFASFGSQIAHPVVMREVWGGKVAPLHDNSRGIATWFHLHNPQDRVFTRSIFMPDSQRIDINTDFDIPFPQDWFDLNHAGQAYLKHPETRARMWSVIANADSPMRGLKAPTVLTRFPHSKRRALLVGINQYPDPDSRLNGCVNDVFLMSQTLQRSGYDSAEIRLLLDERATHEEILRRLNWLVDDARPGDERVFFYSGHGAQIPQYGPSDEPDHMDETLVPVDFDWNDSATYFTDKHFREFYSHLPFGAEEDSDMNFTVIFDCCHAGGMTRGRARVRGLNPPNDIRHRMMRWDEKTGDWVPRSWLDNWGDARAFSGEDGEKGSRSRSGQGTAQMLRTSSNERFTRQCKLYGHHGPYMPLLLYAARERELASEYDHGALAYGAFTYAFVEQLGKLKDKNKSISFSDLINKVGGTLKRRHFSQHPEIIGPNVVKNKKVPWVVG
jgi:phospholipase C